MEADDTKKAIIITLKDETTEIIQLAKTLDYTIEDIIVQHREKPDVSYYIGTGKLEEIKDFIESNEPPIDLVIIDGILKPSQWFNLEKKLDIEVYDRIHIILAIFENHAKRKEAKLQVQLAQLKYERPYVRELIHRARTGEHPGFMAGGEYQVDDYYEMIKKQIKKTGISLKKIEKSRLVQRKNRHEQGFYLVSLAGYTNAGKSSLMNLLTDAKVLVEGNLFSTLSTTTRKLIDNSNVPIVPILLTDTVGFIDDLPSWVVDAFHATLEEIEMADVVILLIDGSESIEEINRKVAVSFSELRELNVSSPVIVVFNKCDLISEEQQNQLATFIQKDNLLNNRPHLFFSVKKPELIKDIRREIYSVLPNLVIMELHLPTSDEAQSLISYLYSNTDVQKIEYGTEIVITIVSNNKLIHRITKEVESIEGQVVLQKQKNI